MNAKSLNKKILTSILIILLLIMCMGSTSMALNDPGSGGAGAPKPSILGGNKLSIGGTSSYNVQNPGSSASWSLSNGNAVFAGSPHQNVRLVMGKCDGWVTLTVTTSNGSASKRIAVGAAQAYTGDDGELTSSPPPPSISFSPSISKIHVDETVSVQAIAHFIDVPGIFNYTWSSSDSSVAKVVGGRVTGVKKGKTTINCKEMKSGTKGSFTIEVVDKNIEIPEVVGLTSLQLANFKILKGSSRQVHATCLPNDANNYELEYSSDNPSVASVTSSGYVTGVKEGEAHIKVVAKGEGSNGLQSICLVTVTGDDEFLSEDNIKFSISSSSNEVNVGKNVRLSLSVDPSSTNVTNIEWTSNNAEVASVGTKLGKSAYIKANGVGTATITVTGTVKVGGEEKIKKAECKVKVVDPKNNFFVPSTITIDLSKGYSNGSWNIVNENGIPVYKSNFTYSFSPSKDIWYSGGTVYAKTIGTYSMKVTPIGDLFKGTAYVTISVVDSSKPEETEASLSLLRDNNHQGNSVKLGDAISFKAYLQKDGVKNSDCTIVFYADGKEWKSQKAVSTNWQKYTVPNKECTIVFSAKAMLKDGTTYTSNSFTIEVTDDVQSGCISKTYYGYKNTGGNKTIRIKDPNDKEEMIWDPADAANRGDVDFTKLSLGTHKIKGWHKKDPNNLKYNITIVVYDASVKGSGLTKLVGETISLAEVCTFSTGLNGEERSNWTIGIGDVKGQSIKITDDMVGKQTVTVYYSGQSKNVGTVSINVTKATGISVVPSTQEVNAGDKVTISATLDGELKEKFKLSDIEWSVGSGLKNLGIVKDGTIKVEVDKTYVDNWMTNTNSKTLSLIVAAKCGKYTASSTLKVIRPDFKGITTFSYANAKMNVGESQDATIVWNPEYAKPSGGIKFSSSDPDKVSVNSNGKITANAVTEKNKPVTITLTVGEGNKAVSAKAKITVIDDVTWGEVGTIKMLYASPDVEVSDYPAYSDLPQVISLYEYVSIKRAGKEVDTGELTVSVKGNAVSASGATIKAKQGGTATLTVKSKAFPKLAPLSITITVKDLLSGANPVSTFNGLVGTTVTLEDLGVTNSNITMKGYTGILSGHKTYVILTKAGTGQIVYYKFNESDPVEPTTTVHAYDVGFGKGSYTLDGSETSGLNLDQLTNIPSSKLSKGSYSFEITSGGSIAKIEGGMLRATGVGNGEVTVKVSATGTDKTGTTKVIIKNVEIEPVDYIKSYTGKKGTTIGIDYFLKGNSKNWAFTSTGDAQYLKRTDGNRSLKLVNVTENPIHATAQNSETGATITVSVSVIGKEVFEITSGAITIDSSEVEGVQTHKIKYVFEYGTDAELWWSISRGNDVNNVYVEQDGTVYGEAYANETRTVTGTVYRNDKEVAKQSVSVKLIAYKEEVPDGKNLGSLVVRVDKTASIPTSGKWASSDTSIVKISSGKVKGVAKGSTKIKDEKTGNYYTVSCIQPGVTNSSVEMNEETSISISSVISDYSDASSKNFTITPKYNGYLKISGGSITAAKLKDRTKASVNVPVTVKYGDSKLGSFTVTIKRVDG